MLVIKRDGKEVEYNKTRVLDAITAAMSDTIQGVDTDVAHSVAERVTQSVLSTEASKISVEAIQDIVERKLMDSEHKDAAKMYVLYRDRKERERGQDDDGGLLSKEFLRKYKHKKPPMTPIGEFVYHRTYSRWLPEKKRREEWWETVRRAVEYNCSLLPTSREEAEKLYDGIFNLRQFVSGRTLYVGGTDVVKSTPLANFNCAGTVVDNFKSFSDGFYLLLVGSGLGIRIYPEDVDKLPKVRGDLKVTHKFYENKEKKARIESTSIVFSEDISTAEIIIGDSKTGWADGLDYFLKLFWDTRYKHIRRVIVNYDNIRLEGEPLKTFGGYSSGYKSLKDMFDKIYKVITRDGDFHKLSTLDCLDIANVIAENVRVGGIRRSSELALIKYDDEDVIKAKKDIYRFENGKWTVNEDLLHRHMSNNTILYKEKPTKKQLEEHFDLMRKNGEPAIGNYEAMLKRSDTAKISNPCFEIILQSNETCNLVTVNVMGFVKNGELDKKHLIESQKRSARAAYRMTFVDLELPNWDATLKEDRLTGCSLTGWQDMKNAVGMSEDEGVELLKVLRESAHSAIEELSEENKTNKSKLITCIKPEGSLSQLPTVSSGLHFTHSEYFIRRVRITRSDPLAQVAIDLGWPVKPEVGQTWENCNTLVVEFPVKSPKGKTKYDVSAIEQLETYKRFMENYVDHNASITVSVKKNEWEDVKEWVWNNWDVFVGVSFLSLDDSYYELMPYESINEETYSKMLSEMNRFNPSLINKYEKKRYERDVASLSDCESGICPVR